MHVIGPLLQRTYFNRFGAVPRHGYFLKSSSGYSNVSQGWEQVDWRTVGLKVYHASESPGRLVKPRWLSPTPRVGDPVCLQWGTGICITSKFPVDAAAAGLSSKLENPWVQEQNGSWYWMRKRGMWKKLEGWSWNFCPGKAYMQSRATDTEIKRADMRLQGLFWMSKERCRAEVQSQMGGQMRILEGCSGWAEMTRQADEDLGLFWVSRIRWRMSPAASANKRYCGHHKLGGVLTLGD